jgi:hypothetical protein
VDLEVIAQIGGPATAVSVKGAYAFVAIGANVQVLDVSDRQQPRKVANSGLFPPPVRDLEVLDNFLYIAHNQGLQVIDVTDPAAPRRAGSLDTAEGSLGEGITSIALDRHLAIALVGTQYYYTTWVIDTSQPADPRLIARAPFGCSDVAVSDDFAYLACGERLLVLDLARPTSPHEIGHLDMGGRTTSVAVVGSYVYIAGEAGLGIVDVLDPSFPRRAGHIDTPGSAESLVVVSGYAYMADGLAGMRVIDVSDPKRPDEVASIVADGAVVGVAIEDDYAYLAAGPAGLSIIDIADPRMPQHVGRLASWGAAQDVHLAGNVAFVAAGATGVAAIDVTHPKEPRTLAVTTVHGVATRIAIGDDLAFVATNDGRIATIDITRPASLHMAGSVLLKGVSAGGIHDVVSVGNRIAYIAAGRAGFRILAAQEADRPLETGALRAEDWSAVSLAVDGDYAYVSDESLRSDFGLRIISVADPNSPRLVGTAHYPSPEVLYRGLALANGRVYTAAGPSYPLPTTKYRRIDSAPHPANDSTAVVVGQPDGPPPPQSYQRLVAIDVADPRRPRVDYYLNVSGWPNDLTIAHGRAFIASALFADRRASRLLARELSTDTGPGQEAILGLPAAAVSVAVAGQHAFVAADDAGLILVRIGDLPPPTAAPSATATSVSPSETPPLPSPDPPGFLALLPLVLSGEW